MCPSAASPDLSVTPTYMSSRHRSGTAAPNQLCHAFRNIDSSMIATDKFSYGKASSDVPSCAKSSLFNEISFAYTALLYFQSIPSSPAQPEIVTAQSHTIYESRNSCRRVWHPNQ